MRASVRRRTQRTPIPQIFWPAFVAAQSKSIRVTTVDGRQRDPCVCRPQDVHCLTVESTMTNITPSGCGFVDLLEAFRASGGTAPGDIVARLLVEHRAGEAVSLARLVHSGQVFGFEWRASLWIPMFQFNAIDLTIAAGPLVVRSQLPGIWSGWTVAMWFAMPNTRLKGRRPVDLMTSDFEAVLRAARNLAAAASEGSLPAPQTQESAAHA